MDPGKRVRAIWRRVTRSDPVADAARNLETVQRTILRALDGSDRRVADVMRRGRRDEAAPAPAPPPGPRHFERFEALCEQLRQDALQIRRTRPQRAPGAPPLDPAASETRRREADARLEAFAGDLAQLERQCRQEQANAEEWRRRAMLAVGADDDDLAREALARAREHDALSGDMQRELDVARRVSAELGAALAEVGGAAGGAGEG